MMTLQGYSDGLCPLLEQQFLQVGSVPWPCWGQDRPQLGEHTCQKNQKQTQMQHWHRQNSSFLTHHDPCQVSTEVPWQLPELQVEDCNSDSDSVLVALPPAPRRASHQLTWPSLLPWPKPTGWLLLVTCNL